MSKGIKVISLSVVLIGLATSHVIAQQSAPKRQSELEKAKSELATLREKYTEAHPAVQAKRQQISALEATELERATRELTDLLQIYTERHPKVIQKRQEIAALEHLLHPQVLPREALKKVEALRNAMVELNDLLERYTEKHPLVVAKRKEIAGLQADLAPH